MALPPHLRSTWELLSRAFPSGIPPDQYLPVLSLLYPHMADENLVSVVAAFASLPEERVLNDVYLVGSPQWSAPTDQEMWKDLRVRLERAGFEEWSQDGD